MTRWQGKHAKLVAATGAHAARTTSPWLPRRAQEAEGAGVEERPANKFPDMPEPHHEDTEVPAHAAQGERCPTSGVLSPGEQPQVRLRRHRQSAASSLILSGVPLLEDPPVAVGCGKVASRPDGAFWRIEQTRALRDSTALFRAIRYELGPYLRRLTIAGEL